MLIFLCFALAAAQLDLAQHSALMTFYAGLGCNMTTCPRFAASQPCPTTVSDRPVGCTGPDVVSIKLGDAGLTGTIASAVALLTALTSLFVAAPLPVGAVSDTFAASCGSTTCAEESRRCST